MAQKKPPLRNLFESLEKDYNMPSYEEFAKNMASEKVRSNLYKSLEKDYDLPDFTQFSTDLGFGQTTQQATSTPSTFSTDLLSERPQSENLMQRGFSKPSEVVESSLVSPTQQGAGLNYNEILNTHAEQEGQRGRARQELNRNSAMDGSDQVVLSGLASGAVGFASGISSASAGWSSFIGNLTGNPFSTVSAIEGFALSDKLSKKAAEYKKVSQVAAGVENTDKSSVQHLEEGNYNQLAKSMYVDILEATPQLLIAAGTGGAGIGLLGTSAAGSNMQQQYNEDGVIDSSNFARSVAVGLVEGVSERIFNADIKVVKALMGGGLPDIIRTFGHGVAKTLKGAGEETVEEIVATTLSTIANKVGTGTWDEKAKAEFIEELKGAVLLSPIMGGGVSGLGAVASYKPLTKEENRKIEGFTEVLNNPEAGAASKEIAKARILQIQDGQNATAQTNYDNILALPLADRVQYINASRDKAALDLEIETVENIDIRTDLKNRVVEKENEMSSIITAHNQNVNANKVIAGEENGNVASALKAVASFNENNYTPTDEEGNVDKEQVAAMQEDKHAWVANGQATARLENTGENTVVIESFKSRRKGKGEASELLSKLTDEADKNGTTLQLTAIAENTEGALSQKELVNLYKRKGFVFKGRSNKGVRIPTVQAQVQDSNKGAEVQGSGVVEAEGNSLFSNPTDVREQMNKVLPQEQIVELEKKLTQDDIGVIPVTNDKGEDTGLRIDSGIEGVDIDYTPEETKAFKKAKTPKGKVDIAKQVIQRFLAENQVKAVANTAQVLNDNNIEEIGLAAGKQFTRNENTPMVVAQAYHEAKATGGNPTLVTAVDKVLAKATETVKPKEQGKNNNTQKEIAELEQQRDKEIKGASRSGFELDFVEDSSLPTEKETEVTSKGKIIKVPLQNQKDIPNQKLLETQNKLKERYEKCMDLIDCLT